MNQGKIAFIFIILIAIACLLFSCSDLSREKIVDKSELTGRDYRLFQNTPAWELAKAVEDENTKKIDKIVSENPEIINYQESKYGNTLLMLTIMNQQLKPFKALLKEGLMSIYITHLMAHLLLLRLALLNSTTLLLSKC